MQPSILTLFTCLYYRDPTKYNGHRLDVKALLYRGAYQTGQAHQCNNETKSICVSSVGRTCHCLAANAVLVTITRPIKCDFTVTIRLNGPSIQFDGSLYLQFGFSHLTKVRRSRAPELSIIPRPLPSLNAFSFLLPTVFCCNRKSIAFRHLYWRWCIAWILQIPRSGNTDIILFNVNTISTIRNNNNNINNNNNKTFYFFKNEWAVCNFNC